MEIFGVKFAPLNVPLKRRLETLSAAVCIVFFAFGNFCGYILTAYFLFFTETMRYFILLYFVWMYYDWNKTDAKTVELDEKLCLAAILLQLLPNKINKNRRLGPEQVVFVLQFPAWDFIIGGLWCFRDRRRRLQRIVSGDRDQSRYIGPTLQGTVFPRVLSHQFVLAISNNQKVRRVVSSTSESLNQQLSMEPAAPYTGRATVLIVGGAAEAMECKPGTYRILIKRRKGFVKLALKNGAPLVPVCSFGETNLFDQVSFPEGSFMNKLQNYIRKKIGIAPVIPIGRGFFQYTFVGSPMELPKIEEPTVEQIDEYHGKFIEHVVDFFEKEKHKYVENADSVHLEFV
ncbi:hypothetical protein E2986_13092 [Frieseomelitta varia]|uniref:Acyltransferase n=1 Tax=Frieseomelitta varia TaxID=561572 RepID=A0A833VRV3_9HYME|nr:hypothetical protein E2986_13092 [Frieseomelitta varia]